jgi:proteasome assembly chaperone (PAC2) family protein
MTNRKRNIPGYNKSLQLTPKTTSANCQTRFVKHSGGVVGAAGQLNSMLDCPNMDAIRMFLVAESIVESFDY